MIAVISTRIALDKTIFLSAREDEKRWGSGG